MTIIDVSLFTIVSIIEYFAIMILTFAIFRIQFSHLKYQILFIALALTFVSYTLRSDDLLTLNLFVQPILIFLFIWMIFKIHPYYALIMSGVGYFSYGLIQAVLMLTFNSGLHWPIKIVAICSAAVTILLSFLLRRKNMGWAFVPTSEYLMEKIKKQELIVFITTIIFSIVAVAIAITFTMIETDPLYLFIAIIVLALSVSILFYLSNRKEKEEFHG